MKGEGMFQDRKMGKLPLHNKMGDYFPRQIDPNNPDIYYAGDVADGTAQNMEGAAPRQSDYLTEDGRAIDANKPGAQMSEAGARQEVAVEPAEKQAPSLPKDAIPSIKSKKEIRATKQGWNDRKRLRKGLDINTDKTYNNPHNDGPKENVAKYITAKKSSERQEYSPSLSTDVSATPSTINKSKYKNVFEKGDYVGTVKKREGKALNEIFQSNPAPPGLNIKLPKLNVPKLNLKLPKVDINWPKINLPKRKNKMYSTKFSTACPKGKNC